VKTKVAEVGDKELIPENENFSSDEEEKKET